MAAIERLDVVRGANGVQLGVQLADLLVVRIERPDRSEQGR